MSMQIQWIILIIAAYVLNNLWFTNYIQGHQLLQTSRVSATAVDFRGNFFVIKI